MICAAVCETQGAFNKGGGCYLAEGRNSVNLDLWVTEHDTHLSSTLHSLQVYLRH